MGISKKEERKEWLCIPVQQKFFLPYCHFE